MRVYSKRTAFLAGGLLSAAALGCGADASTPGTGEAPPGEARQATTGQVCVTIQRGAAGSVADAKLRQDDPDTNFGGITSFVTGSMFTQRVALLGFDLSPIPAGMTIDSATVTLGEIVNHGASTIDVHLVTAPWAEGTVTWNSFHSAYDPAVATSFSNGGSGYTGPVSFDMISLVKSWYAGAPNNGVALLASLDVTWASSEDATATRRPALQVCYSPPSCGNGILDAGEQCDDGNNTNGDGCNATCQLEGCQPLPPAPTVGLAPGTASGQLNIAYSPGHVPQTYAFAAAAFVPIPGTTKFQVLVSSDPNLCNTLTTVRQTTPLCDHGNPLPRTCSLCPGCFGQGAHPAEMYFDGTFDQSSPANSSVPSIAYLDPNANVVGFGNAIVIDGPITPGSTDLTGEVQVCNTKYGAYGVGRFRATLCPGGLPIAH